MRGRKTEGKKRKSEAYEKGEIGKKGGMVLSAGRETRKWERVRLFS